MDANRHLMVLLPGAVHTGQVLQLCTLERTNGALGPLTDKLHLEYGRFLLAFDVEATDIRCLIGDISIHCTILEYMRSQFMKTPVFR